MYKVRTKHMYKVRTKHMYKVCTKHMYKVRTKHMYKAHTKHMSKVYVQKGKWIVDNKIDRMWNSTICIKGASSYRIQNNFYLYLQPMR